MRVAITTLTGSKASAGFNQAAKQIMNFELKDVLQTAGPTAALVFASWIFLQLLTQKFTAAFERYCALATEYRADGVSDERQRHLAEQIPIYKRRCEQMQRATLLGVIAAILLIFTLLAGTLETILGGQIAYSNMAVPPPLWQVYRS
jgi:hypothetical protein